jgi:hypothetical protein
MSSSALLLLLSFPALPASAGGGATLWSSAYGASAEDGAFINVATPSSFGSVDAFATGGIKSMISPFLCRGQNCSGAFEVFRRGTVHGQGSFLVEGWEAKVDALVDAIKKASSPSLVGAFLGDEVCCHNATCLNATLQPVAGRLKTALSPSSNGADSDFIVWTNECGDSVGGLPSGASLPSSIDILSVDLYAGFLPGTDGADEVAMVKSYYEEHVFPRMHAHTRTMVVPGFFGRATWVSRPGTATRARTRKTTRARATCASARRSFRG